MGEEFYVFIFGFNALMCACRRVSRRAPGQADKVGSRCSIYLPRVHGISVKRERVKHVWLPNGLWVS